MLGFRSFIEGYRCHGKGVHKVQKVTARRCQPESCCDGIAGIAPLGPRRGDVKFVGGYGAVKPCEPNHFIFLVITSCLFCPKKMGIGIYNDIYIYIYKNIMGCKTHTTNKCTVWKSEWPHCDVTVDGS